MKDKEHFLGEDIDLSFEVFKSGKKVHVINSMVKVYMEDGTVVDRKVCQTSGNKVSCVVDRLKIPKVGEYTFVFLNTVSFVVVIIPFTQSGIYNRS